MRIALNFYLLLNYTLGRFTLLLKVDLFLLCDNSWCECDRHHIFPGVNAVLIRCSVHAPYRARNIKTTTNHRMRKITANQNI
jgi:hypothetical protein